MAFFDDIPTPVAIFGAAGGLMVTAFAAKLPEPIQVAGALLGVAAIMLCGISFVSHILSTLRGGRRMGANDLVILGLAGVAIFALLAVGALLWTRVVGTPDSQPTAALTTSDDIAWDFNSGLQSYFIGFAYFNFVTVTAGPGQPPPAPPPKPAFDESKVTVMGFQANGKNLSASPIAKISGYIQSDISNEQLPINFVVDGMPIAVTDTYGIPGNASFSVTTASPGFIDAANATPAKTFLREFASFTFVFDYDGKTYKRHFSKEEVQAQWIKFHVLNDPSLGNEPRVTKKTAD